MKDTLPFAEQFIVTILSNRKSLLIIALKTAVHQHIRFVGFPTIFTILQIIFNRHREGKTRNKHQKTFLAHGSLHMRQKLENRSLGDKIYIS